MNRATLDSPAGRAADDGASADPGEVAERASVAALLRCCLREVAGPRGQVWAAGPYLTLRLAGHLLRVPTSGGPALRFDGPAERLDQGAWHPLSLDRLVRLVEAELGAESVVNDEFAGQVAGSRDVIAALVRARRAAAPPRDAWLASEQALVFGHPFHPSPKAREGAGWERYAPEAHAAFPLRLLGVREDVVASGGEPGILDALGEAPDGYVLLPAHPWQLGLLGARTADALADGRLVDLGEAPGRAVPTSSVRTVYEPRIGICLKFSLDVRITNCVRKNAWYELVAAAELTRRLEPVFGDLALRFPGTRWLAEPGYRSAALGTRLLEGLGVIVRRGPWEVTGPGVTPVLAGALAIPGYGASPEGGDGVGRVAEAMSRDPAGWWGDYVERVAVPVLDAYFRHGVVLEPHLQNVLVGISPKGMPVEAIFRDLEGTKLVTGRHDVSGLPAPAARAACYDATRGWNRVVYCLMVNHLPEIAATVAVTAARTEVPMVADELLRELWAQARSRLARHSAEHGRPSSLSDLLAGAPLPAKANLTARWARSADRDAGYVPIANPFAGVPA
ncbi:iron transporter [Sphaerisporangium krabiense]|uniref:Siderophore synthetase component n=1 Tax=Sphaerisporangium krabiense TaxID=763782 RepID=A0A7W9DQK1_9ACTN|nr:IucA/IucC family protein [Sphaerisporangium krabiense]MBB5627622.1 siderophore synthetase component [Sphaerisporangium krabiense]GII66636.1 iron transporter [Sphaerisporangium krabiense]